MPEYINGMKIESHAQGNLEQYFVFLPRIFSALRKIEGDRSYLAVLHCVFGNPHYESN